MNPFVLFGKFLMLCVFMEGRDHFISVTDFFISNVSVSFFLRISISFLTLPIYSCRLSTFPIRILSILITVTSDPNLRIPEFLLCLFRLFFLAF